MQLAQTHSRSFAPLWQPRVKAAMRGTMVAVIIAASPGFAQTVKLKKPDFDLPLGVMDAAPAGVTEDDVYVDGEFCFWAQVNGKWVRFTCVG